MTDELPSDAPARTPSCNLRIKRALTAEETAVRPLTGKERLFVAEYMTDLNATRAALRAGYAGLGTAWRLMRRPAVRAAMREAIAARAERAELTADMVMAEISAVAFTSLSDIAEWGTGPDGQPRLELKESVDLPPAVRRGLGEIRFTGGGVGINTRAKVAALGLLMKHMGLLEPMSRAEKAAKARAEAEAEPGFWDNTLRLGALKFLSDEQLAQFRVLMNELDATARAKGYDQRAPKAEREAALAWLSSQ